MQRIAGWNSARDAWETDQVDLLSGRSDVYSETFPISGSMRNGVAYEQPMSAHHTDGSGSLWSQLGGKLMPSPRASDGAHGGPNQRGSKGDLTVSSAVALLPTATAADANGSGGSNASNVTLTDAVVRTELGTRKNSRLLPSPTTSEANGIGVHGTGGQDLRTTVALLPTPTTTQRGPDANLDTRLGARANLHNEVAEMTKSWGPYAAAIRRWEEVLGREAPEPTEVGPKGGRRLSAVFVAWMMGVPDGWVTAPELGLSRVQQLRMLGNGVVTQQAVAALRAARSINEGEKQDEY